MIYIFLIIILLLGIYNNIETFRSNMIGKDTNGSPLNVPAACKERSEAQCAATGGCEWKSIKERGKRLNRCVVKKGMVLGYGKGSKNIYLPTKCALRNVENCEALHGCSYKNNLCIVTPGWAEGSDINKKIVQFPIQCKKRGINYCMIGGGCFLDGGVCMQKPRFKNRESRLCNIDRNNLKLGDRVNICKNLQEDWTPEMDIKDDVHVPIPIMAQTKTCWHCSTTMDTVPTI